MNRQVKKGENFMKRISIFLIVISLLLSFAFLVGCSKQTSSVHYDRELKALNIEVQKLKETVVYDKQLRTILEEDYYTEEELKNLVGNYIKEAQRRESDRFSCDEQCGIYSEKCIFSQALDGDLPGALIDCETVPGEELAVQTLLCFCAR